MLDPAYPAATVAGNVETSQAVTGALYGALGGQAEGSGTMNNLTFGNDRVQYYETIASGSGAGDGFDGTDAVQTHMTNSRLTDPEILEWRLPVRLESFTVREGSGGAGRWHGGGEWSAASASWSRSRWRCSPGTAGSRRTGPGAGNRVRSGSSTSSGRTAGWTRWRVRHRRAGRRRRAGGADAGGGGTGRWGSSSVSSWRGPVVLVRSGRCGALRSSGYRPAPVA